MPLRPRLLLILATSILFSLALLAARAFYTGSLGYFFLLWNLFLAAIPLGLSTLLVRIQRLRQSGVGLTGILSLWFLFFPNAPYIVTDLLHLRTSSGAPIWFDLILITSFSWSGMMLGFLSLSDLQELLEDRFGKWIALLFAWFALVAGAFGIYIGRFLRWNSWDLLTRPTQLLSDVAERVLNPLSHPAAVGVSVLLSVLLLLWYATFRTVAARRGLEIAS